MTTVNLYMTTVNHSQVHMTSVNHSQVHMTTVNHSQVAYDHSQPRSFCTYPQSTTVRLHMTTVNHSQVAHDYSQPRSSCIWLCAVMCCDSSDLNIPVHSVGDSLHVTVLQRTHACTDYRSCKYLFHEIENYITKVTFPQRRLWGGSPWMYPVLPWVGMVARAYSLL